MSGLSIRTRAGVFRADLDGSDISNAIWLSLPLELYTNMLGGMAYCECPLKAILPKEDRVTVLDVGDIAYWPGPGALCFFFGPTPLSGEDGRPVAPYPVIRIGRIIGDCSTMEQMGDRQRIVLESDFRLRLLEPPHSIFAALYRFTKSPVSRETSTTRSGAKRSAKQHTNSG